MLRLLIILLLSSSALLGIGQSNYKTGKADNVKAEWKPMPQNSFFTSELEWGGVASECTDTKIMYGKWFRVNVSSDKVQFTVHTGDKMGDLKAPYVYLGKVKETPDGRIIEELSCTKAEEDYGEFSVQAKDLNKKGEYYALVGGADKGERFVISVTEKFVYQAPAEEAPESNEVTIMGRVRDEYGKSREGVEVSLLDDENKLISSAKTNSQGMFRFEKLAPLKVYLARIEAEEPKLEVDIYLYDGEGHISETATKIGDKLYAFSSESSDFNQLQLLKERDWTIDVKRDKSGIMGRVVDAATHLYGIKGVNVGLYSGDKNLVNETSTDANGSFKFSDLDRQDYVVKVDEKKDEHFTEMVLVDDLNVPYEYSNSSMADSKGYFKFERLPLEVVELKRMEVRDTRMPLGGTDFSAMEEGAPIILKNILFESASSDLMSTSHSELDRLVKELQSRASVKIEISGHTDNTGVSSTNLILSQNRAKSVQDYLISKGVDKARLTFKGFGETKPIADNATDEGKRKNRRVEFIVVE
ncbi:MAG: OmpA family protein [Flavobacteriales bacterium]|nr:OmpA family protein [Flavobacteriales bacterium]MBT4931069.1 OmpA family protein [Flavobacteriales bacterium]MBT5133523.1 OmpA family protein [Flavobacteriales bacterium]MBT6131686.1 OmpA family protein [Flavobacteriales bacterium]MBT6915855.1 OmpA family protein [Flavobacteriales bacterium]